MSLLISIILLCTLTQICIPFLEALWLVVETDKKRNARQNMCKPLLPRPTQLLSSLTILGLILSACKDSHIFWTTTLYPRFGKFVICDSKTLVRFKERPRKGSVPPQSHSLMMSPNHVNSYSASSNRIVEHDTYINNTSIRCIP